MKRLCNGFLGCVILGAFVLQFPAGESAQARVVYHFCSQIKCTDGANPYASLIDVDGTLYGTTYEGGNHSNGVVFSLDPSSGAETVLYSFCNQANCTDGANPKAALIDVDGTLYGTTALGGSGSCTGYQYSCGTVFSIDLATGTQTVLYSFCSQRNCTDGANPYASLTAVNGTLYGTTYAGGNYGKGTVFSFDPNTGAETVLYSFCSQRNCTDGANPYASLTAVNGTLYGTTYAGGNYGKGTVFSLDLNTGAQTTLHSFGKSTDGRHPAASLVEVKGKLYGTTVNGGIVRTCTNGCGTLFSLDPGTGRETELHFFSGDDGANPYASLTAVNGTLYGTTHAGGNRRRGTVFSFDLTTGIETVLYSFCSHGKCADGSSPEAALLKVKGTLYGTTLIGGRGGDKGVIFKSPIP